MKSHRTSLKPRASHGKSPSTPKKSRRFSTSRPPPVCLSSSAKADLLTMIAYLRSLADECRVRALVAGFNGAMKLLEVDECAAIVISRECVPALYTHIAEAAALRHLPIVFIPRPAADLARELRLPKASIVALVRPSALSTGTDTGPDMSNRDAASAALDRILEFITEQAAAGALPSKLASE